MMLQLGLLTGQHFPLAQKTLARFAPKSLRDLVKLKPSDWLAVIEQPGVGVPAHVQADKARYAAGIVGMLQLAFPVEASAHAIGELDAKHFGGEGIRDGVSRLLLNATSPEQREQGVAFDLGTTHIDGFLERHWEQAFTGIRAEQQPQVVAEAKRVQRLYRISTRPETLAALLRLPAGSAYAVACMPRSSFVAAHGAELGGDDEAGLIHDRAVAESTTRLELARQMSQLLNEPLPRAMGG